ncbi:hypothetical protein SUGI_0620820 [Cryptomeria japonica]|nr:hypothetical protein SUGI_0620820 [Cryptomeria japonica]
MSEDRHGVLRWVKTEVNVDDHVIVPEFPPGQTEYDEFVNLEDDPNLPLNFPSSKSVPHKTTSPYYSWVSAKYMYYMLQRLVVLVLVLRYTLSDLIGSFLRMTWMDDSKLPIRGPPGVEMLPKVMTHDIFPMEDITKIKKSIGGTVNDVIMGVIFYGFQRYLETTHSHCEICNNGSIQNNNCDCESL